MSTISSEQGMVSNREKQALGIEVFRGGGLLGLGLRRR
jgi:hypothetical protein